MYEFLSAIEPLGALRQDLAQLVAIYFFGTTSGNLIGLMIYNSWLLRRGRKLDPKYSRPRYLIDIITICISGILWFVIWALGASRTVSTNWYWVIFASLFSYVFIKATVFYIFTRIMTAMIQREKISEIEKQKKL